MYTPFKSDLIYNMDHMRISGTEPITPLPIKTSTYALYLFSKGSESIGHIFQLLADELKTAMVLTGMYFFKILKYISL